jgi:hypothetical protein
MRPPLQRPIRQYPFLKNITNQPGQKISPLNADWTGLPPAVYYDRKIFVVNKPAGVAAQDAGKAALSKSTEASFRGMSQLEIQLAKDFRKGGFISLFLLWSLDNHHLYNRLVSQV